MDVISLKDWLGVAALLISVGGAGYAWITRDGSKALSALTGIREDIATIDKRVAKLEAEMEHLPSKDDVVELKLVITEMKGSLAVFGEALGGVQRTVSRIDGYLRDRP